MVIVDPLYLPLQCGRCYLYCKNGTFVIHRLFLCSGNCAFFIGDNHDTIHRVKLINVLGQLHMGCSALLYGQLLLLINKLYIKKRGKLFTINPCRKIINRKISYIWRFLNERKIYKTRN